MKTKDNKAITLIALVVTIIVLLILAGVSINFIFGADGIFSKSQYAVDKYKNAQEEENVMLGKIEQQIDSNRETIMVDKAEYDQLKADVAYLKANSIKYANFQAEPIKTISTYNASWSATEDCVAVINTSSTGNSPKVYVNAVQVYENSAGASNISVIFLKKGDTISTRNDNNGQVYDIKIYPIQK